MKSRVIQCRVKKRTIRRVKIVEVECFKCGKSKHKCKRYLLWERRERVAHVARSQKAHQQKEPACPAKGKVQERKLRRTEEKEAMCVTEP